MPFMPDQVVVYGKDPVSGQERLVSRNPYKLFQRLADPKDKGTLSEIVAQGGYWWYKGSDAPAIPPEQVPDWVWQECRAMAPEDRAAYRILLPEEIAEGRRIPNFDEQEEYPSKKDIVKALYGLDPAEDSNWTADGLASLMALRKVLGVSVTRARVDAVAPDFVRPR